jgi:hypothetical protein
MLVKIKPKTSDPILGMIAAMNGNDTSEKEIKEGVYQIGHFNFENSIPFKLEFDDKYPSFSKGQGSYGVCDHYSQIFGEIPEILNSTERSFVISITEINKNTQPSDGGWRWHKWGEYIGNKEPQCEYLYDEPEIERVFVYSVYELTNHLNK